MGALCLGFVLFPEKELVISLVSITLFVLLRQTALVPCSVLLTLSPVFQAYMDHPDLVQAASPYLRSELIGCHVKKILVAHDCENVFEWDHSR